MEIRFNCHPLPRQIPDISGNKYRRPAHLLSGLRAIQGPSRRAHARDTRRGMRREISASNVQSLTADEGVQQQNVQHVMTCRPRGFRARETRCTTSEGEKPRVLEARPAACTRPE